MFEVKYPLSHGLDGKIHKIAISYAVEIEDKGVKRQIIYGEEGEKNVIIEVKYSDKRKEWVKVPNYFLEYAVLTRPFTKKKDITAKMLEELDGKKITNIEELDYIFGPKKKTDKKKEEPKRAASTTPPSTPPKKDVESKKKIIVFRDPRNNNKYISISEAVNLGFIDVEVAKRLQNKKNIRYADDVLATRYFLLSAEQLEYLKKHFTVEYHDFKLVKEQADGKVEPVVTKKEEKKETTRSSGEELKPIILDDTVGLKELVINTGDGGRNIIIDQDFLRFITSLAKGYHVSNKPIEELTKVYNVACKFFAPFVDTKRKEVSGEYVKLSKLQGNGSIKGIERTIVAYVLLRELYKNTKMGVSLVMMPSELNSEVSNFILLDNEKAKYPMKHMVLDVNNTLTFNTGDKKGNAVSLYALTDEECDDLLDGLHCSPATVFEVLDKRYADMENKQSFGPKGERKSK